MKAEKDADGNLVSVDVTIRTTERIAEGTLATGVRLAVLDTTGAVLTSTSVTPTLSDDWTANWHLTADDWNALVTDVPNSPLAARRSSLSIAVTSTLRASDWSTDLPILPAPDWAIASRPVYASAALPVEARESLTTLGSWLDGITASSTDTRVVYEVGSLGALGTLGGVEPRNDPAKLLVSAPFQAQPFLEPLNGQDYVRNRWYDPATGSWLSPDPLGYRDSRNLYAFAGGDPVNGRDPTGRYEEGCTSIPHRVSRSGRPASTKSRHRRSETKLNNWIWTFAVPCLDPRWYYLDSPSNMRLFHMVTPQRLAALRSTARDQFVDIRRGTRFDPLGSRWRVHTRTRRLILPSES